MQRSSIPNFPFAALVALLLCICPSFAQQGGDNFIAPDTLVLKDGSVVRGLILRNSVTSVLLQNEFHEAEYPKSEIVRINDQPDDLTHFTGVFRKGDLPPWRVIANDLRTNDQIRSVLEIPATMIDNGVFKNVPYKSFRVNNDIELNIYGDPADPAGIEMGIYGWKKNNAKLRRTLRGYLAGFLTTREEIAALYSLDLNGGTAQAGNITLEITPANAPDAYGAWWISLFNPASLAEVRLSDAEYAKITCPHEEIMDRRGRVRSHVWSKADLELSEKAREAEDSTRVLLRGFYRAPDGVFRLINTQNAR